MNQEIKLKLEQAAAYHQGSGLDFMAGAQTILENPEEWGLVRQGSFNKKEFFRKAWRERARKAESQLSKYREALESILIELDDMAFLSASDAVNHRKAVKIAKEALKQEDATCPKCGYPLFKHLSKTCCQGCDYVKQQ